MNQISPAHLHVGSQFKGVDMSQFIRSCTSRLCLIAALAGSSSVSHAVTCDPIAAEACWAPFDPSQALCHSQWLAECKPAVTSLWQDLPSLLPETLLHRLPDVIEGDDQEAMCALPEKWLGYVNGTPNEFGTVLNALRSTGLKPPSKWRSDETAIRQLIDDGRADGTLIGSCGEYVDAKYRGYIETARVARDGDWRGRAFVSGLAAGLVPLTGLKSESGDPLPDPLQGDLVPKNLYYELELGQLEFIAGTPAHSYSSTTQLALDPGGHAFHPRTEAVLVALDLAQQVLPDDYRSELYRKQEEFRALRRTRENMLARWHGMEALAAWRQAEGLWSSSDDDIFKAERDALSAVLEQVDGALDLAVQEAVALGCMDLNKDTPCDMSARRVEELVTEKLAEPAESDMARCLFATKDAFANGLVRHATLIQAPQDDYTTSFIDVETYIGLYEAHAAAARLAGQPPVDPANLISNYHREFSFTTGAGDANLGFRFGALYTSLTDNLGPGHAQTEREHRSIAAISAEVRLLGTELVILETQHLTEFAFREGISSPMLAMGSMQSDPARLAGELDSWLTDQPLLDEGSASSMSASSSSQLPPPLHLAGFAEVDPSDSTADQWVVQWVPTDWPGNDCAGVPGCSPWAQGSAGVTMLGFNFSPGSMTAEDPLEVVIDLVTASASFGISIPIATIPIPLVPGLTLSILAGAAINLGASAKVGGEVEIAAGGPATTGYGEISAGGGVSAYVFGDLWYPLAFANLTLRGTVNVVTANAIGLLEARLSGVGGETCAQLGGNVSILSGSIDVMLQWFRPVGWPLPPLEPAVFNVYTFPALLPFPFGDQERKCF